MTCLRLAAVTAAQADTELDFLTSRFLGTSLKQRADLFFK